LSQPSGAASEKSAVAPAERREANKDENQGARAPADNLGRLAAAPPPAAVPAEAARAVETLTAAGARTEAFALARQAGVIAQEVVSPTPLVRWRIGARGLLQYSASGGAAWEELSIDLVADLVAGASPSPSVCWVVGRAGTVLRTIDGRRFNRVPFPANVDLTAVRATDARTAVVTTADGRTFSTADGGSTWTP